MKLVLSITLSTLMSLAALANNDLVSCAVTDRDTLTSRLRIFQSQNGYFYEFNSCEGSTQGSCTPHESHGEITRVMGEITIGNDFISNLYHSDNIGFGHLFGYYTFSDGKGATVTFPNETCVFVKGDFTDVVARGEVGDGVFGTCAQSQPIGYEAIAKQRADASGSSQCAPLKARRISDYDVFSECLDGFTTGVARAIYRCE